MIFENKIIHLLKEWQVISPNKISFFDDGKRIRIRFLPEGSLKIFGSNDTYFNIFPELKILTFYLITKQYKSEELLPILMSLFTKDYAQIIAQEHIKRNINRFETQAKCKINYLLSKD